LPSQRRRKGEPHHRLAPGTATPRSGQATSAYASVAAGRDDCMVLVAINKSTGPTTAVLER